jgi:hypothetical protein
MKSLPALPQLPLEALGRLPAVDPRPASELAVLEVELEVELVEPGVLLALFTVALSLNRLVVPRWAPRLELVVPEDVVVDDVDEEVDVLPAEPVPLVVLEVDVELVDDDEVSVPEDVLALPLMLPPPPPPPPMPPRPRPVRLPRICGAIKAAKCSAETTPVSRTVA